MPRIEQIYAYVQEDTGPDDEGIVAQQIGRTWMPLVGADITRKECIRQMAQNIANATGKPVKLLKFSVREEIEILQPKP